MAKVQLTADTKQVTSELQKVNADLVSIQENQTKMGESAKKATKEITDGAEKASNKWTELASKLDVFGKVKEAFGWVKDNVQAMESLQTQFTALSLFDASGKFRKVLNESIVLTKGVANEYDLIATTNELMQQGFDFTEEQFRDLIDVGARYASVIGVDINKAIEQLSKSSLKEREGLMRQMGVTLDMNKALDDYAKKLGTTVEGLSDVERQSAILNAQVSALKNAFDMKGIDNTALMSPISTAMKQMDTLTQQMTDKIIAKLGVIATAPATKLLIKIMGGDEDKKQLADLERQVRLNDMIVQKYGEGLSDKQKSLLLEKESLMNEQKKRDVIQEQKEQMEKGLIQQHQGDLVSNRTGGNIRKIKDMLKETRANDDLYQAFKKANVSTDAMSQHMRMMKIDMELMMLSATKIQAGITEGLSKFKDDEEARIKQEEINKERRQRIYEANKEKISQQIADEMKEWKENQQIKMDSEAYWANYQIKQIEKVNKAKHEAILREVDNDKKKVEYAIKSKEYMDYLKKGEIQLERDMFAEKNKTLTDFNDGRLIKMKFTSDELKAMSQSEISVKIKNEKEYYDAADRMANMGYQKAANFSTMLINDVLMGEKEFRKEMIGDFIKGIGDQMVADGTFHVFAGIAKGWGGNPLGWKEAQAGAVEVGVGVGLGATGKAIGTTSSKSEEKTKETAAMDRTNTKPQNQKTDVYLYPNEKPWLRRLNKSIKKIGSK